MSSRYSQQSFRTFFVFLLFMAFFSALNNIALAQSYVFGTGSFAVTGYAPGAMVSADFNHDGKLDLAVANQNGLSPSTVSVLLGRPDGSFSPKVDINIGSSAPTCIAVGDFNQDGNPDLVVGLQSPPTIEILLGKGDGTFAPPTSFQISSATSLAGVVTGDFNHDGKADLAVADASASDGMVTIFLGNGDGTFQPGVNYATGGSQSMIAADFNNDGNLDLAVGGSYSSTQEEVSVLLGNGDGTFKPYVPFSFSGLGAVAVAAGDLNGDGKPDLVAATATTAQGGVDVLIGNGDGTFQAAVFYSVPALDRWTDDVAIGDFDGDGIPDVAAVNSSGNDVSIFKGNGDGTFQNTIDYGAGINPEQVIVGDFNSDGHLDLAATGGYLSGYVTVLVGMGGGTFTSSKGYSTAATPAYGSLAGDFNGDGNLDLVGAGFAGTGSVSVLLGNSDGTFQNHVDTAVGSYPAYEAAGDFNRDGKLDMVVANTDPTTGSERISVLLGNGDRTFTDTNDIALPSLADNIVVADFNNDGNPDFATIQQLSTSASVFLGRGNGTFANPNQVPLSTNQSYLSLFTADFNNDGKPDLATSINTGTVLILLGNGDGTFQPATSSFSGDTLVAVGDFNGDGKTDLLVYYGVDLYVGLANGDGTFQPLTAGTYIPGQILSPATGDFNGDGKLDIATAGVAANGSVSVLLGNGDGTFGNRIDYLTENGPRDPVAGDFNHDGSLDLAVPIGTGFSIYLSSPVAALDPGLLSFPDQPVGTTSAAQSVTLINSSGTPFSIASITASGDFAETNTCGTSLAPMANCQVSVTFTPTGGGLRPGVVTIDDNAPGSPQAVALYGTGTLPTASVSPTSISFSGVEVGTTSTVQAVTLSNTSSAVLTISSVTTSGDFAQTNNCGGSLTGGASCTINVTFTPTAAGSRSGTLSIADNASSSVQTVALSGSGEDFTLSVASGSSSSASVSAGGTATFSLTLAPEGGFNQAVSLACSGAPSRATCTVSPASNTLDGTNPAAVKVTVTTTAASVLPPPVNPLPPSLWLVVMLLGTLGLLGLAVRRRLGTHAKEGLWRLRWAMLAGTLLLAAGLAACGGGSGGGGAGTTQTNPGTPTGTYTLNVTGTSGNLSHSQSLTLTVK
jgi:FG-GAP-like repeat/Cep192 domain 4